MPTINQLIRKPRKPPVVRNKVPALEACPQKRPPNWVGATDDET